MSDSWATSSLDLHLELAAAGRRAGLENALRAAVQTGRLAPGTRLPSSRALAGDLGLARNTVADAYGQLVAEGWLTARQGSGTRVAADWSGRVPAPPAPRPATASQARYDLAPGRPDLTAFPTASWLAATRRALARVAPEDLGYGDPCGLPALRTALASYVSRVRGVDATPDRVVVCAGFAPGLALLGRLLAARGVRAVAIEAYGLPDHRAILESSGLALRPVAVDMGGASIGRLPEDAGAVLLTPAHQFPLGGALAAARRGAAVDWAARGARLVVEDDYDGEFRYDRHPVGAMQSLAPDRVVYAGTASKTLVPGLRLGWLVVPPGLAEELAGLDGGRLVPPGAIEQLALAELIDSGGYDRHVRRSRLAYRRRRDRLVEALRLRVPGAQVSGIAAGLHLVLTLPPGLDEATVIGRARGRGLRLEGLSAYATGHQTHPPALVIGYGTPPEHAFSGAVARLVASLTQA